MIPDDVHPKPLYRKLIPRSEEELKVLNKELERIRKSLIKDGDGTNDNEDGEDCAVQTKKNQRKKKMAQSKDDSGEQTTNKRGRPKGEKG